MNHDAPVALRKRSKGVILVDLKHIFHAVTVRLMKYGGEICLFAFQNSFPLCRHENKHGEAPLLERRLLGKD